ncbi:MAG: integration host factor subunit beta [Acidithiobacillus sp.]|nr:integration host factor subunit beta [Acidithiobacillus sp.]
MNKSDLIGKIHKEVSRAYFAQLNDTKEAVEQILLFLADKLAAGERIEIRDFGSLHTKLIAPRLGRNPRTGEQVSVPPKLSPRFKPGKELREIVDRES